MSPEAGHTGATGGEEADRLSTERMVLVTVALSTMLAPLNSTMIAVAMPRIMEAFTVDLASAGWLVTAYLIGMASLQPISGKLGDRFGRRRLMLGGLVYFGGASLGAAVAGDLSWLLFFRVQQAIAGAIVLPNGVALVREIVPAERRAGRFGMISSAVSLAAAGGPPLGGLLIGLGDWQSIFYVNLLFILPALFIGYRSLPVTQTRRTENAFDLTGAILLLALLVGTAGFLIQERQGTLLMDPLLGGLVLAVLLVAFLWREWRHPDPVLQPRFFRHRTFAAANGGVMLSNLAMYSTLLAIPILVADRPGWTSARTGLVLAALSAATVVCAPLGGYLADRWGRRWPAVFGLSIFTCGLLLLLRLHNGEMSVPILVGSLGVAGIGLGLSWAGMQTASVEAVAPQQAGVASGIYSTSRYLGSIVGSSLLAGLLSSGGFTPVLIMVITAAFLSALVSLALHDRPTWKAAESH